MKNDDIRKVLSSQTPRKPVIPADAWLSLGATRVNLAITARANAGIAKGMYLLLVGDAESIKSWVAMSILGEASINSNYDDYQLIYDSTENGVPAMDIDRFFGKKLAERIGSPGKNGYSSTVQEFYYNVDDMLSRGPGIYVLDSMDGIMAKEDQEQFEEEKEAFESGKEVSGSYGTAKAKANSQNLQRVVSKLAQNGSILVIISQTRQSIGKGPFVPRTRSGGKALKFYAHVELWTSVVETLKRNVRGKERVVGSLIEVQVQKNRLTGWHGKVQIPFLAGHGIDDVGSCVDYLVEEKYWKKDGSVIVAPEFKVKGDREAIVQAVEDSESERELQLVCQKVWREVLEASRYKRKNRYA